MAHVIGGFAQRSREKYRLVQGRDGLWHKRYAGTKSAKQRNRKLKKYTKITQAFSPLQGALIDQMNFRNFKFVPDKKMSVSYQQWFHTYAKLAQRYSLSMHGLNIYRKDKRISRGTMLDIVDAIIRKSHKRMKTL